MTDVQALHFADVRKGFSRTARHALTLRVPATKLRIMSWGSIRLEIHELLGSPLGKSPVAHGAERRRISTTRIIDIEGEASPGARQDQSRDSVGVRSREEQRCGTTVGWTEDGRPLGSHGI